MKFFDAFGSKQKRAGSANRYHWAAEDKRLLNRFLLICLFILALILLSSYLVWRIEYKGSEPNTIETFWDSIWWAIVTVATVGYGDKVPLTPLGRTVGLVLIIAGFTLLSVFSGLIASLFVEDRTKGAKGLKQIKSLHHILICGWNKTGDALIRSLSNKNNTGKQICIVSNQNPEFFEKLMSQFPMLSLSFVRGEATQEDTLRRASAVSASHVIILADQNINPQNADDRTVIIANAVHYLSPKAKITVQLLNNENKSLLERLGISDIIVYDDLGGNLLASNIFDHNSLAMYAHLLSSPEHAFCSCEIDADFVGRTFGDFFDFAYRERKQLVVGLLTKATEMNIDSIFGDNSSAIDQFIKSTLATSKTLRTDEQNNMRWNPDRQYQIQEDDYAIILM